MVDERLHFSANFFLLSLVTLSFAFFSSELINTYALKNTYTYQEKPAIFFQTPAGKSNSLSLFGPDAVKLGESFEVFPLLNSANKSVQAVDLVLEYDPSFISFKTSTAGNLFGETLSATASGSLRFSFLADDNHSFSGQGQLSTLAFTAKKTGKTQLKILFTADSSQDSNIILAGETKDSLDGVDNLEINIL